MAKLFEKLYSFHLNWLEAIGKISHKEVPLEKKGSDDEQHIPKTFEEWDEEANTQGNLCRASGVAIGYLGFVVIFCAVAPTAFHIQSEILLKLIGITKVSMMLITLFLIWIVSGKNGAKARWIRARRAAERLRYAQTRDAIQDFEKQKTEETRESLKSTLASILDGQISYNQNKAKKYEAIEVAAKRLSWWGFFSALACAFLLLFSEFHLLPHHSELVLGTAFIPAMVGSIHGINGFLDIGGLAESHAGMAKTLTSIRSSLEDPNASNEIVIDAAWGAYRHLSNRDDEWERKIKKNDALP